MTQTINSTGASGELYTLYLHPIGTSYRPVGGVYMFLRGRSDGNWDATYIGESGNLDDRLNTGLKHHQAWHCISNNRSTHIATMAVDDASTRLRIETDLRHSHNTACNLQ